MYKLAIKKSARKELDALPDKDFLKIDKAILSLRDNPFPYPNPKSLKVTTDAGFVSVIMGLFTWWMKAGRLSPSIAQDIDGMFTDKTVLSGKKRTTSKGSWFWRGLKMLIAFLVMAKDDTIIPPGHAKRLVEKWAGPRTLEVLEGVDHNSVDSNPLYWEMIRTFLSRM